MSVNEILDSLVPGSFGEQAMSLEATAFWLKSQLAANPIDDRLSRLMVLLMQARPDLAQLDDQTKQRVDTSVMQTLGAFFEKTKPMVVYFLRDLRKSEVPVVSFDDLVSMGLLGEWQALERFDLYEEAEFFTFAQRRIRGAAIDEIRERGASIKIPRQVLKLQSLHKRDPELKTYEGDKDEALKELSTLWQMKPISLDAPMVENDEGEASGHDMVADEGSQHDFLTLEKDEYCQAVLETVAHLPYREREVILMVYGLPPYESSYPLNQISLIMGVSESRVSQLHTKAVTALREMIDENL